MIQICNNPVKYPCSGALMVMAMDLHTSGHGLEVMAGFKSHCEHALFFVQLKPKCLRKL